MRYFMVYQDLMNYEIKNWAYKGCKTTIKLKLDLKPEFDLFFQAFFSKLILQQV